MNKYEFLQEVKATYLQPKGYTLADVDELKPWGAYYRFADDVLRILYENIFLGVQSKSG